MGSTQVLRGIMLSILRQEANQSMRRPAISSVIKRATRRHLYQSKALDLLFQSMQVLIGMVERSTNGNRKQEDVAIVDDFKASTTKESDFSYVKIPCLCYHVGLGTESTWKALEKLAHDYLVGFSTESTARIRVSQHVVTQARCFILSISGGSTCVESHCRLF